jgi:hypothetical protein
MAEVFFWGGGFAKVVVVAVVGCRCLGGGGCGGIGHGGFFGFRACAVWGCFIKGSLSVGGNVLGGMWQCCVAMFVG